MSRSRLALGIAALILMTVLAYLPAVDAGFIWDDDSYVTENRVLTESDGLAEIWFEPGATPQYYPLVFTTYWFEYRLWGLNPMGYHLVNILLHALVACFLWIALRKFGLQVAFISAAVFALHPVHVESAAWVTERKNLLSGLFYILSFLLFLRACSPFRAGRTAAIDRYAYGGSLLLFLFALLSKTVACSLPAVILLLIWWKRGRLEKRFFGLTAPYFLFGFVFAGITLWMERHHVGAQGAEWSFTLLDRFLIAGRALWFYISKLLVPRDLTFIYTRWEIDSTVWWQYLFGIGFLIVVVCLWWFRARLTRGPLIALLFFAGSLLPALGFFDVYPMRYSFVADHFQYLASVGLIVLILSLVHSGLGKIRGLDRRVVWVAGALLLGLLGMSTWDRSRDFHDPESLWSDTIAKNPSSWMAHHNLGIIYEEQGKWRESRDHYRAAIRLRPDLSQSYFNLGTILAKQGDWNAARRNFERTIECEPEYADAHLHLANVLYSQGDLRSAVERYRQALRIDPGKLSAHKNLALALRGLGLYDEALVHYRAAATIDPNDPQAVDRLAWILATAPEETTRNGKEAVMLSTRVCRESGFRHGPYLVTLAAAYAEAGEFDSAIATIDRAIEIARGIGSEELLAELDGARERYRSGRPTRLDPAPGKRTAP